MLFLQLRDLVSSRVDLASTSTANATPAINIHDSLAPALAIEAIAASTLGTQR